MTRRKNSQGVTPQRGRFVRVWGFERAIFFAIFRPISRRISETVQDTTNVTIEHLIGNCISAFDWDQNQRPWMTLK